MAIVCLKVGVGLVLAAAAAFAALMGIGGPSFSILYVAWIFVPAPFAYAYYLYRLDRGSPWRPRVRALAFSYMAASTVLTALLLLAVSWVGSERAINPSPCDDLTEASDHPALEPALERVEFTSRDGTGLVGWLVRGSRDEAVVLVHGYGCRREQMLPHAEMLHEEGFTVLLFDTRNRGESGGDFVAMGYYEKDDALAAVEYLGSRPDLGDPRIGMLGLSLGGVAAILAAAESAEVLAVAAEAPFRSVDSAVSQSFTHFIGLPAFPFAPITVWLAEVRTGLDTGLIDPVGAIPEIAPRPVLIMHGDADETISHDDSRAIFEAAAGPAERWIIPGAGHADGATDAPGEYGERIVAFFEDGL